MRLRLGAWKLLVFDIHRESYVLSIIKLMWQVFFTYVVCYTVSVSLSIFNV